MEFTIGEPLTLLAPVELYEVTPHTHCIGKELKLWAKTADEILESPQGYYERMSETLH